MAGLSGIAIDKLPQNHDARGTLSVAEFSELVPFPVVRLFFVTDVPAGTKRGGHAHKRCRQYMICQSGRIHLEITDGHEARAVDLVAGQAVLVEPGVFASETYVDPDTVLLVLCDRPYERDDYIHSVEELRREPKGAGNP